MIHRRHGAMRFEKLLWITKAPPKRVGLYLINTTLPRESGIDACISSRITTGIQVVRDYQINYNWYNEPFAVFKVKELYLDMHGLIFETSVWLLAESTRLLSLIPMATLPFSGSSINWAGGLNPAFLYPMSPSTPVQVTKSSIESPYIYTRNGFATAKTSNVCWASTLGQQLWPELYGSQSPGTIDVSPWPEAVEAGNLFPYSADRASSAGTGVLPKQKPEVFLIKRGSPFCHQVTCFSVRKDHLLLGSGTAGRRISG